MKYLGIILIFSLTILSSGGNKKKIAECKKIAEQKLTNLEGYTLYNKTYTSRRGLKLAIPNEYESATHIAQILYKKESKDGTDYKGCSCYFQNGKMIGSKASPK